jgi:hypothetical protein
MCDICMPQSWLSKLDHMSLHYRIVLLKIKVKKYNLLKLTELKFLLQMFTQGTNIFESCTRIQLNI